MHSFVGRRGFSVLLAAWLLPSAAAAPVALADQCAPTAFCPAEVKPFDGPNGPSSPTPPSPQPPTQKAAPAPAQTAPVVQVVPAVPAVPAVRDAVPAVQTSTPVSVETGISVDPPVAGVGDVITVSGQGLRPGRSVWINLAQTQLGAKQLSTLDDSDPQVGPDGTLLSTLVLPDMPDWAVEDVSICVVGATSSAVCTPFTMMGTPGTASADSTSDTGLTGPVVCAVCSVVQNNQDRLTGVYNSGTGHYEYHGAHP